jgi:hypothetical protein
MTDLQHVLLTIIAVIVILGIITHLPPPSGGLYA